MKLNRILFYALISIFLLEGGIIAQAQSFDTQSNLLDFAYNETRTIKGYGTMKGVGKFYMVLNVSLWGSSVTGKYYYVKTNKNRKNKAWIYLSGSWNSDTGDMILYEQSNSSKAGAFHGYYWDESWMEFTGTFIRNDGKRFKFEFIQPNT